MNDRTLEMNARFRVFLGKVMKRLPRLPFPGGGLGPTHRDTVQIFVNSHPLIKVRKNTDGM